MNKLQAGFSRVNINPPMGTPINGYYKPRYVEGVLDDLEITTLALRVDDTKVLMMSIDNCLINAATCLPLRQHVADVTGVPVDAVFIHTTHTHTAATIGNNSHAAEEPEEVMALLQEYHQFVRRRLGDAARLALADLKDAKMGWSVGEAPNISFVRRFRMADGKVRTNPGVGNPDILHPIGDVDERVNVLRFDRADDTLVLANFGCHPDTVGGSLISADWPGFARRRLEKALDNVKCIFFNGAEGDVNHVNVKATKGDFNDMFNDFDDVARGYGHARHMGNVVAGAVLQVYDKVNYEDVDSLRYLQKVAKLPSNMPKPEDIPLARKYNDLHEAGKDDEIPFKGMELTTVVAEAARMLRLEHGPEYYDLGLGAVALGNIALFAIPGEPFTGIGRGLKEAEGWTLVMPMCLTNGSQGYFPMKDAYEEGGYEARSSNYKVGTAEQIIVEGLEILKELRDSAV